ncbi:MAG: gliding motility-associated C-terminal domain-containing protein, partial [Bacteroidales bacterium]|nr:gliding motility-associated C-terminal domain-containing protein [Bacteroidales bacterium]
VVTDANGCSNEISEIIVPESKLDCLRIPNVITPNGDGVNDEWIIENIELFPEAHIYVYNRWGQLLYHDRGNGERWDGSYRGHFVPSGVYMYIIKLESVEETYEGTVTVLY